MYMLGEMTIKGFLAETASSAPVPGGGSVAALSASVSASLIEMVAGLTIGKKGFEEVEGQMKEIAEKAANYKEKFVADIDRDADSFNVVSKAYKMPKETDEDKKARSAAIQDGLKLAATVPMEVAEDAFKLLAMAEVVVTKGNQSAVTDGAVATMMARTAVLSALYNVEINLGSIKDADFVAGLQSRVDSIKSRVHDVEKSILATVKF
jgi:methenyltetrahydrofolate cyclohydrolase